MYRAKESKRTVRGMQMDYITFGSGTRPLSLKFHPAMRFEEANRMICFKKGI